MKRPLALSVLALAAPLVGAACSSKIVFAFDPGICARASACLWTPDGSFGESCELLRGELHDGTLGWLGTDEAVLLAWDQCIASAADCTAMKACTQPTPVEAAACGGPTTLQACSGDVLVGCGTTPSIRDCAAGGAHCFASSDTANCGSAACDPATTPPSCNGDFLVECFKGAVQRASCAYVLTEGCTDTSSGAETCTTQASDTCAVVAGTAQCVGSGALCDAASTPTTCHGAAIVSCTAGKVARFDCAQYSGGVLTCTSNGDGRFSCGNAGTQCSSSTPESCDGSVLGYCWFGNVAALDCKGYGLSGCATTTQNGSTWAHCTP